MYAGTLKDYQGVDDLIKAAKTVIKKFPKTTFGILGDGGLGKAYFEKMVSRLKLEKNFIFYGMVPHTEVRSYLQQADILVSPRKDNSITRGGFVSQMPEYMAMGKMIVATAVSDCDKMLANGAGILVEPNSPASLANGILLALKEKKNWPRYTKQAQKNARIFSWENNAERLLAFYKKLVF
jgi:glycosyltransferase involved in cell wall biosynthesis